MSQYKPSSDFQNRYSLAKRWRDAERPYLEEIYSFICPGREYDFSRSYHSTTQHDTETFISLAEELALDFASDLVTYFTPAEAKWAEYLVTADIPQDAAKAVTDLVTEREAQLFDLIQTSNYNDIAPQLMFEVNHGTTAMWVQQGHISQPIHCEVVPPHELLVLPGYMGILDRFREQMVPARDLRPMFANWPEVDLQSNPKLRSKIEKGNSNVKVCWGFWLSWEDPGNPMWKFEITIDGDCVTKGAHTLGPYAGSCPLLTGRFNPIPGKPWGRGPARKSLPDLRVLNKVDEVVLTAMDQALHNTLIYPDDGFLDFSEGMEVGRAYPASRGFTRDQIYELQKGTSLDYGWLSEERLEERIRAAFYQDGPRQRGDTPPTASQWLDERRRVQQRLGKPSAPLWKELFIPFIQRIETLGVESGKMEEAISHQGEAISVLPISPLQKAQNQDKVLVARSNLDLGFAVFGERIPVDPVQTFQNIVRASGDELTVVAEPQVMDAPPTPQ
jgi:hypothetical protein